MGARGALAKLTLWDVLWSLLVVAGSVYAYTLYRPYMDDYEVAIQIGATLSLIAWGWYWKPARVFALVVAVMVVTAFGATAPISSCARALSCSSIFWKARRRSCG